MNTKHLITFFMSLTLVLVLFQNCARDAGFSSLQQDSADNFSADLNVISPNRSIVEHRDDGAQNLDRTLSVDGQDSVEPAEAAIETSVFEKSIEAFDPKKGRMNITLVIDDSRSNAPYAKEVLKGVNDLLDELSPEDTVVKAYSIDLMLDYKRKIEWQKLVGGNAKKPEQGSIRVIKNDTILLPPLASLDGKGLSGSDWAINRFNFTEAIEKRLRVGRGGFDRNPIPHCGILANLSQKNQDSSPNDTHVVVIITDEDSRFTTKCRKSELSTETVLSLKKSTSLSFEHEQLSTLEGGVKRWRKIPVGWSWMNSSYFSSCAEAKSKPHLVEKIYSNSIRRMTSNTVSSCKERVSYFPKIYRSEDIEENYEQSWINDKKYALNQLPSVDHEFDALLEDDDQGPIFFGLFSLLPSDKKANSDQEAAVNLKKFLSGILPSNRLYHQSLLDKNYGQFIENVMNFKINSEINRVSIGELLDLAGEDQQIVVKSVILTKGSNSRSVDFSIQGDQMILHNTSIDLSQGANIRIEYYLK